MMVHQVFAMIHEEEVKNVFVCENHEMANYLARATYDETAIAVYCNHYSCRIGDSYRDRIFYHISEDGTESKVEYIPTQEQEVSQLKYESSIMAEYQMDLDYRMSCQELNL